MLNKRDGGNWPFQFDFFQSVHVVSKRRAGAKANMKTLTLGESRDRAYDF